MITVKQQKNLLSVNHQIKSLFENTRKIVTPIGLLPVLFVSSASAYEIKNFRNFKDLQMIHESIAQLHLLIESIKTSKLIHYLYYA
jgi:hypothetical protein